MHKASQLSWLINYLHHEVKLHFSLKPVPSVLPVAVIERGADKNVWKEEGLTGHSFGTMSCLMSWTWDYSK